MTHHRYTPQRLQEARAQLRLLDRIEALTGKKGEEAVAVALSWKADHEDYERLSAELAALEVRTRGAELAPHLAAAKAAGKLTPAEERTFREQVAAGDLTVQGAVKLLAAKGVHRAFAHRGGSGPAAPMVGAGFRSFGDMKPVERAALKREDPEAYKALRAEWKAAGEPGPGGAS